MKTRFKKIILAVILLLGIIFTASQVKADVGSFESYSSGSSSSGSSSWSSSSSWGSGSRHGSGTGGIYIFGDATPFIGIAFIAVILLYLYLSYKTGAKPNRTVAHKEHVDYNQKEQEAIAKLVQVDPLFNKEEFVASTKTLFVKLQQAWTDRDWSVIRVFETNELYEQHRNQLQGYIDNNQINVMDRICVKHAQIIDFRQEGDKDILVVRLDSRMADYIIDATTKKVLKGDKNIEYENTYLMTFIRKKGLQTKEGNSKINTTNCPNCGAQTQITSAGECEYCGSVITTGEYDWVLSNLERE